MGILKRFCRNRNHPEASILQGYTAEEVVEFCTEYMKQRPIGLPLSRHKGRLKGKSVLAGTQMDAPGELAEKAHLTVLLNGPISHRLCRRTLGGDTPELLTNGAFIRCGDEGAH